MKTIITEITKALIIAAVLAVVGFQFLGAYRTQVKNQAIDGCYAQSFYQSEFIEGDKTITTRETQKYIFDQCILDKGIVLEPRQ